MMQTSMKSDDVSVSGAAAPDFAAVREAFVRNFSEGEELGAAFCVVADGAVQADLVGGHKDRQKQTPWTDDTIACVYSSGKAVTALLIARAVSRGELAYDDPVARYWPEFGAAGKEEITIAQALSHQAGLCGFPDEINPAEWLDWRAITDRLAAMAPLWKPGTQSGYHPQTVGFIAGELLRRATGNSVGEILASDFSAQSVFCGIKDGAIAARAAYMPKPPKAPDLGELNEATRIAFLKPWSSPAKVSREDWMAAELPASNMHATARALAEFVYPFANDGADLTGATVLSGEAIEGALSERICGPDLVLPFRLSWAAGIMRNINGHFGPSETAYGHAGFGGSCVVFDPAHGVAIAYVMNKMSPYLVGDPRSVRLIEAVYACL